MKWCNMIKGPVVWFTNMKLYGWILLVDVQIYFYLNAFVLLASFLKKYIVASVSQLKESFHKKKVHFIYCCMVMDKTERTWKESDL